MAIETTSDLSSVVSSQIVDGAVTSAKIADNAVVAAKIAAGAVGSAALASGAVVAASIAAGAVGSAALASSSVVAASIAAGAVGTAAISSGSATSGQILQANGSGAVTFATPAAGGGMTLIATATVSAATTISFTSIPADYKHLFLVWYGVFQSSDGKGFFVRLNNDTTAVYQTNGIYTSNTTVSNGTEANEQGFGFADTDRRGVIADTETNATVLTKTSKGTMTIYRYTDTGQRFVHWSQTSYRGSFIANLWNNMQGIYAPTSGAAVTRIDFVRSSTQTVTGTIYLYGVS